MAKREKRKEHSVENRQRARFETGKRESQDSKERKRKRAEVTKIVMAAVKKNKIRIQTCKFKI